MIKSNLTDNIYINLTDNIISFQAKPLSHYNTYKYDENVSQFVMETSINTMADTTAPQRHIQTHCGGSNN